MTVAMTAVAMRTAGKRQLFEAGLPSQWLQRPVYNTLQVTCLRQAGIDRQIVSHYLAALQQWYRQVGKTGQTVALLPAALPSASKIKDEPSPSDDSHSDRLQCYKKMSYLRTQ